MLAQALLSTTRHTASSTTTGLLMQASEIRYCNTQANFFLQYESLPFRDASTYQSQRTPTQKQFWKLKQQQQEEEEWAAQKEKPLLQRKRERLDQKVKGWLGCDPIQIQMRIRVDCLAGTG